MDGGRLTRSVIACAGVVLVSTAVIPSQGNAQSTQDLLRRIEAMESQLQGMQALQQELEALKAQLEAAQAQAQQTQKQVEAAHRRAREAERADAKWHLAGYASAGFRVSDLGAQTDTFEAGRFNPIFHFQYKDRVLFEAEPEIEIQDDGTTTIELEYAIIDLLLHDNATFTAGKFLSPVGQFQSRLHPDWVNKLPDAPAGFGHGGVQPLTDVGVMLRGGFDFGPLVNYAVFGGNGPRLEFGTELEGIELEGFGSDDNSDKSVGGRIGILPIPHLEIGGSFMTAGVTGVAGTSGPVTEGDYTLWGFDAAYTRGPWDVRFEYLSSELDSFFSQREAGEATELIPATDFDAWYAQVAYKLSGFTDKPIVRNLEPVIRYGEVDAEGFEHFVDHISPEDRLSVGLNYLFGPSIIAKLAVSWRDFEDPAAEDATEVRGQLAFGF